MATGMDMRVTMMAPFFKKHEKDKKVLGMLQPGDVVTVLEVKMDKTLWRGLPPCHFKVKGGKIRG
jgi:hypothetical protein